MIKQLIKLMLKLPAMIFVTICLKCYLKIFKLRSIVELDARRIAKELDLVYKGDGTMMILFLHHQYCFRDIFYWRCKYRCYFLQIFFKRYPSLLFDGNMVAEGGAFFFHHPFSTVINAKYVGYGCTIRNNTTIGNKTVNKQIFSPIISGYVDIGVNTCIIGDLTVGKNTVIGAGSVVVKDVPENTIVAGNPARVIRKLSI